MTSKRYCSLDIVIIATEKADVSMMVESKS